MENDRYNHRNKMDELYKLMSKFKGQEHKEIKDRLNIGILERKKKEEQDIKEKAKKIFMIRHNEVLGLQNRKNYLIDKIMKIKDEKKNELNEEIKIIEEHQKEIEFMGKEENEILEKINKITELQYGAFNQLIEAKKMGSDEVYEKFNKTIGGIYSTKFSRGTRENTRDFSRDRDVTRDYSRDIKYRVINNSNSTDSLVKKLINFSAYRTNSPSLLITNQNPISKPEESHVVLDKPLLSEIIRDNVSKIYSPQFVKYIKGKNKNNFK